ncbi:MAG: GreA/GreB family elongation factor [Acidobacteria bacterium]|nr:GreA/GreB family elongation factor [Acidobacteriota bacterium]
MEEEIRQLEKELRQDLPVEIRRAVALGDLRENAEYQSALERQSFVQARLGQLRRMLADLSTAGLNNLPRDRVGLGSLVGLVDLDNGEAVQFEIVLSEDADFPRGKVSVNSPIGKGLLGRRVGEEVVIRAPSGVRQFELQALRTIHDREGEV